MKGTFFWELWWNERFRAILIQTLFFVAILCLIAWFFRNTIENLHQRGISSGFGFLWAKTGFRIGEILVVPNPLSGNILLALFLVMSAAAVLWQSRRLAPSDGGSFRRDLGIVALFVVFVILLPGGALYRGSDEVQFFAFSQDDPFILALLTGLINTLKVAIIGCIVATLIGFVVGIGRLSSNWLIAKIATVYVEVIRNIPLLVQIFFWYFGAIRALPEARQSWTPFGGLLVLSNRGMSLPMPLLTDGAPWLFAAFVVALSSAYLWWNYAERRRLLIGERLPVAGPVVGVVSVLAGVALLGAGWPLSFEAPEFVGFDYRGGLRLTPEFSALFFALSLYAGAYIAEIVRSGIQSVSLAQHQAAAALGFRPGHIMRLIVIPQAVRVIVPPLTSQYLNLAKQTSLGVSIGYPELVSVGNTTLNAIGQPIEIIAITMGIYLALSLLISAFMGWYQRRVDLVER